MLDFTQKIEELKLENNDLVNFRICFNENCLYLEGEFIEDGINNGFYSAGTIANFFITTAKGYISSEWKNTNFYKIGDTKNISQDFINSLEPYLQDENPTRWIKKTVISVASVMANHINSKVDYTSNKME